MFKFLAFIYDILSDVAIVVFLCSLIVWGRGKNGVTAEILRSPTKNENHARSDRFRKYSFQDLRFNDHF